MRAAGLSLIAALVAGGCVEGNRIPAPPHDGVEPLLLSWEDSQGVLTALAGRREPVDVLLGEAPKNLRAGTYDCSLSRLFTVNGTYRTSSGWLPRPARGWRWSDQDGWLEDAATRIPALAGEPYEDLWACSEVEWQMPGTGSGSDCGGRYQIRGTALLQERYRDEKLHLEFVARFEWRLASVATGPSLMALVSAPNSYELHERMADGRFERVYEFGTSQWSARLEQSSDGRSFVILEGSGSGRVVVLDRDELGGWQVRADPGFWLTGTKSVAFLADGSIVIGVDGRGLWRISGDQLMISPVWTRAELVVPMEGGQAAVVFARDPPVSLTFVDGAEEASVVCSGLNAVTSAAALHGTLFLTAGEAIYAATRSGCVPTGLTADGGDLVSGGSVVHIIGEDGICEGQTQRVIALGAEPPIR